jgi:hypothetical protein
MYRDGEDITSYIIRFERIAELLQLNRSSYAMRLGTFLTGKAVQIYAALSPDMTGDYDSLKNPHSVVSIKPMRFTVRSFALRALAAMKLTFSLPFNSAVSKITGWNLVMFLKIMQLCVSFSLSISF